MFFNRFFEGEPAIDQQRLVNEGVLSVFIQEGSGNFGVTTSDLHVLDFDITVATSILLGDINRDGNVDFFDISPFIALLSACLLYTSPSPRDQRGSRMPSSA